MKPEIEAMGVDIILEEKVVERFFRLSKNEVEVAALKFS
jgi:hypothetical protein